MTKTCRARKTWIIIALLLIVAVAAVNLRTAERRLMVRAMRIAATGATSWRYHYQWLSDHEFLCSREIGQDDTSLAFFRYDTRTRKEIPVEKVDRQLTMDQQSIYSWDVSPDHRLLLGSFRAGAVLVHIDGSDRREVGGGAYHATNYWLGDSRRWLNAFIGLNGHILDYPILSLYGTQGKSPIGHLENSPQNPLYEGAGLPLASYRDSVLTFNVEENEDKPGNHATIQMRSLDRSTAPSQQIVLPFPCHGTVLEAAFSPTCDEVALLLQFDRSSPILRRLHRWLPFLKVEPAPAVGLWCCRLDGSRMRLIGTLDGKFDWYDDKRPRALEWTPGGKHLSFVYNDVLYSVSADE